MDYVWFLKQRTWFIGMFYREARTPFVETRRRIEAGEAPFDNPPFDDSDEPPYLIEWSNALNAEHVVGEQAISMLSATLKLFLTERMRGCRLSEDDKRVLKKQGVLGGWRKLLAAKGLSIDHAPADFTLLEEIELVRNLVQHPARLSGSGTPYTAHALCRVPSPVFIGESQAQFMRQMGGATALLPPAVEVTPETIEQAIAEVDNFSVWLDQFITAVEKRSER